MGCLSRFVVPLVVIAVIAVLVLGYLGFIPGIAGLAGSDMPRDLRIRYTQVDMQTALEKSGATLASLPADAPAPASLRLSGSTPLDTSFTDRELTALIASHERFWKYYPVSDAQIRINSDGTVEASGILRVDRGYGYQEATHLTSDLAITLVERLKLTGANPPFYVKGRVSVENGRVTGKVEKAEIGRLGIPSSVVAGNEREIIALLEERIKAAGISARSVSFEGGSMRFVGTVPESVGFSPPK